MELRLRQLRKAAGYKSARQYAEHIGVPQQTYNNYETGFRKLSLELACEICDDLGCTLDELCGRDEYVGSSYIQRVYESVNDEGKQAIEQYAEMAYMNPRFLKERPARVVRA